MKNKDKAISALDALREKMPRVCDVGDFIIGLNRPFTREDISSGVGVSPVTALHYVRKLASACSFIFKIEKEQHCPSVYQLIDCEFNKKEYLERLDSDLISLEDRNRGGVEVVKFPYKMPRLWKLALGIYCIQLK